MKHSRRDFLRSGLALGGLALLSSQGCQPSHSEEERENARNVVNEMKERVEKDNELMYGKILAVEYYSSEGNLMEGSYQGFASSGEVQSYSNSKLVIKVKTKKGKEMAISVGEDEDRPGEREALKMLVSEGKTISFPRGNTFFGYKYPSSKYMPTIFEREGESFITEDTIVGRKYAHQIKIAE